MSVPMNMEHSAGVSVTPILVNDLDDRRARIFEFILFRVAQAPSESIILAPRGAHIDEQTCCLLLQSGKELQSDAYYIEPLIWYP